MGHVARMLLAMTAVGWIVPAWAAPRASVPSVCAIGMRGMLTAVAASSSRDDNKVLIEHWNGTCWKVLPAARASGLLGGIAALAAHDAWAVGTTALMDGDVLIEHWDGVRWATVPNPAHERGGSLSSVSAVSAHDVWAARLGTRRATAAGQSAQHDLIIHWDGRRWQVVPDSAGYLLGVAALSARDLCTRGGTSGQAVTLTEHWDDNRW
jgi:hypothetical protein